MASDIYQEFKNIFYELKLSEKQVNYIFETITGFILSVNFMQKLNFDILETVEIITELIVYFPERNEDKKIVSDFVFHIAPKLNDALKENVIKAILRYISSCSEEYIDPFHSFDITYFQSVLGKYQQSNFRRFLIEDPKDNLIKNSIQNFKNSLIYDRNLMDIISGYTEGENIKIYYCNEVKMINNRLIYEGLDWEGDNWREGQKEYELKFPEEAESLFTSSPENKLGNLYITKIKYRGENLLVFIKISRTVVYCIAYFTTKEEFIFADIYVRFQQIKIGNIDYDIYSRPILKKLRDEEYIL